MTEVFVSCSAFPSPEPAPRSLPACPPWLCSCLRGPAEREGPGSSAPLGFLHKGDALHLTQSPAASSGQPASDVRRGSLPASGGRGATFACMGIRINFAQSPFPAGRTAVLGSRCLGTDTAPRHRGTQGHPMGQGEVGAIPLPPFCNGRAIDAAGIE